MICELISIGDELLSGEILDTNGPFLAQKLETLGVATVYHTIAGDDYSSIMEILKSAFERSELIICTGGLGPTEDDITREVISDFTRLPLCLHHDSYARIQEVFRVRQLELPQSNKKQAMIPEGARVIANEKGTASGFIVEKGSNFFVALPGVPLEMKGMFQKVVYPELRRKIEMNKVIITSNLNCTGITESSLGEKLYHLMKRENNPTVGTKASNGVITIRIRAAGSSEKVCKTLISKVETGIRYILGDVIFGEGDEGLEHSVGKLLLRGGKTLSTAESCTGGLISHKLTNVSGISSSFLLGAVTYSNEAKIKLLEVTEEMIKNYGAVSSEVVRAMAKGVKNLSGSDYSIAVTGIAGPGGGSGEKPVGLVHIGVGAGDKISAYKYNFSGTREYIKERTANMALNLLRLSILENHKL